MNLYIAKSDKDVNVFKMPNKAKLESEKFIGVKK